MPIERALSHRLESERDQFGRMSITELQVSITQGHDEVRCKRRTEIFARRRTDTRDSAAANPTRDGGHSLPEMLPIVEQHVQKKSERLRQATSAQGASS